MEYFVIKKLTVKQLNTLDALRMLGRAFPLLFQRPRKTNIIFVALSVNLKLGPNRKN